MSSLRFQVYLPSKNSPELAFSSSTPPVNAAPETFVTFSSITLHNPKRPTMTISQSDPVSIPTSTVQNSHIHQQLYVSIERDLKFFRILNRYKRIYHRSFPRTPCGH